MGNIHTVGPDRALFVTGGCGTSSRSVVVGNWAWAWWFVSDVQTLSLRILTLGPVCENVETSQGVPLTVTGVAQVKIMKEEKFLDLAAEQFLGRSEEDIKDAIDQTLEGHLRAILGTLTVEQVYQDRDTFAKAVRETAGPDVAKMGIEILSFTIKDVYDKVEYLESLGKAQTSLVKRDADIGVAQASRDAGIRQAECQKAAMDVKFSTDSKIENNNRGFKLQQATFDTEVNSAKAEAQMAYQLQAAKIQQKIRTEEIQVEVVERRKQIEIEEQETMRKEKELIATVRLPAEAEAFQVQTVAEGQRAKVVASAKGESERIKLIGAAEARAVEAVGRAEAEQMRMKAAAYAQYGDAAVLSLVLEALPQIAAEVAAPLSRTGEIVLIGGSDKMSQEVTKLIGTLPPAVQALTGVDISRVLERLPGARLIETA
eukprot:GFUD01097358.1.p1 GENE.GFUD01097358.1~~GFUD01097358.1.p1  ORF type:complete len:438 (+),score=141.71 GFUD01097358.1:29-1315(+)